MSLPVEKECPACLDVLLYQSNRSIIKENGKRYVEYKCQSCGYRVTWIVDEPKRKKFNFGNRPYLVIDCDDTALVEPRPHAELRSPNRLIVLMALCILYIMWHALVSTRSHELARGLQRAAVNAGYLVEESLLDESSVEGESEETDRQS